MTTSILVDSNVLLDVMTLSATWFDWSRAALKEDIPWPAAFLAGRAHVQYRRSGGTRTNTLPDFFIGAHALVSSHFLLARDTSRFETYFPGLQVISPDTHP